MPFNVSVGGRAQSVIKTGSHTTETGIGLPANSRKKFSDAEDPANKSARPAILWDLRCEVPNGIVRIGAFPEPISPGQSWGIARTIQTRTRDRLGHGPLLHLRAHLDRRGSRREDWSGSPEVHPRGCK